MANVEILGIKIQVDTADLPKLQAAAKDAGVAVKELGDANRTAGQGADEHAQKQATLEEALGASRRQVGLGINALGEFSGANRNALQSAEAFASGIGPVGIGIVTLSAAIREYIDWLDKAKEKQKELTEANVTPGGIANANVKAQVSALNDEIDRLAKQLVSIESGLSSSDARMRSFAQSAANAVGGVDHLRTQLEDLTRKRDELTSKGYVSPEQISGILEFTTEADRASQVTGDWADRMNRLNDAYAQNNKARQDSAGAFVEETQAQGDAAARAAEMQVKIAGWNQDRVKQEEAQRKAASAAQAEAQKLAEFQKQGAALSQIAGEKGANAYNMIANSALSAEQKVAALAMYEQNNLPENIRQQIQLYLAVNGDALLMKLLGGKATMGGVGHQQGDEWGFTLEGENFDVRKAYMDKYGDYGRANDAWQRDHRAELEGKGVTGYGQANTQTGQTYDYGPPPTAAGGIVTSPQVRLVGEAGPEAIIPLDRIDETMNAYMRGMSAARNLGDMLGSGQVNNFVMNLVPQKASKDIVKDFQTLKTFASV